MYTESWSGVQNTPLTVKPYIFFSLHITWRGPNLLPASVMYFETLESLCETVIMMDMARDETTDRTLNRHDIFTKHAIMITFAHVEFKWIWLATYYKYRSNE